MAKYDRHLIPIIQPSINPIMNLAQILAQTASRYGEKPAIIFEEQVWSYADLDRLVMTSAHDLEALGVQMGDRVTIILPKSVEFLSWHLAIMAIGAISLPLNPDYRSTEITYFLTDSTSTLLITTSDRYHKIAPDIAHLSCQTLLTDQANRDSIPSTPLTYPCGDDAIAMICYTSGTTGKPKGAMISHRNLISNMQALHSAWQWSDRDRLLHVLPLFHVHGLNVAAMVSLYAGATMIMLDQFAPYRTWQFLESQQCTLFMAVPTIYQRLIDAWEKMETKPNLSSLRLFVSGSAPLSAQQFHQFAALTGFPILERYGMTETGMNASNPIEPNLRLPLSVGFSLAGVEIQIAPTESIPATSPDASPHHDQGDRSPSIGEVLVRGDNVFQGYWQMPDKTAAAFSNGWFHTGDLGYLDAEGRLFLVGRAKELIITSGFNVYPKEVENVLDQHPSIKESAVIGLTDRNLGEIVTAAIVLQPEQTLTTAAVISYCKKELISYKCPRQVFFVDALPRNALGKLQKHLLSELLQFQ
ncbi:MAG: AMP-binding protein [Pseudanabaenaceae cyanobacterium bins.39]|nr:AMP-binding protein [Pseudanabaenaceae cyanobacterium bins.39]